MALQPPSYTGHKAEDAVSVAEASLHARLVTSAKSWPLYLTVKEATGPRALALPTLDGLTTLDLLTLLFWLPTVLHYC